MKKEETVKYTVEREFLSKVSTRELLARIIKSHQNNKKKKDWSDMKKCVEIPVFTGVFQCFVI